MADQKSSANTSAGLSFWGWPAVISLLVFLLDQGTKIWVDSACPVGWQYSVIPRVFTLVHVRNTGSAWGMFSQHTWALALCSIVAFLVLIWKFRKWNEGYWPTAGALALLLGGIAGNMLDRVVRHSVIDFLSFHWDYHEFPAFNIADSAITVSVFLLLFLSFRGSDADKKDKAPDKEE